MSVENRGKRGTAGPVIRFSCYIAGFSAIEFLVTIGLVVSLVGMAMPSYRDAVEKRQVIDGAQRIAAFVENVRSEAIAADRPVVVAFAESGAAWCLGATPGPAPCDCSERDPRATGYCMVERPEWSLRESDAPFADRDLVVSGGGAFVFDPAFGGVIADSGRTFMHIGDGEGRHRLRLDVRPSGSVAVCVPEENSGLRGFEPCG